jgi:hypothetical protein
MTLGYEQNNPKKERYSHNYKVELIFVTIPSLNPELSLFRLFRIIMIRTQPNQADDNQAIVPAANSTPNPKERYSIYPTENYSAQIGLD